VVHIAPNREAAEGTKARLAEEGLLAVVRAVERATVARRGYFEVLVPQTEAEEALEILNTPRTH
jgi:hypothetical protein